MARDIDTAVTTALAELPAPLQAAAAPAVRDFLALDVAAELPASLLPVLGRTMACSEFAAAVALREAAWLVQQPDLHNEQPSRAALADFASEIAVSEQSMEQVQSRIRSFRNRHYLHILWREYAQTATLDETLQATSELADQLLAGAVAYAERQLQPRYGVVRSAGEIVGLVTLGMGKLGGRELNLSSDIDLIFLYPDGDDSDGSRSVSAGEYFTRVVRTVVTLLEAPTADGFAFRVDTRLRPFGDSGPPVTSFAALESYLLQHGRGWERYAYVKARIVGRQPPPPVAADLYDNMILPFVYRRYLDYGVFESLREMHALIAAEVTRRDLADNLKLGPGGIREIEFIAQSLQLVRGGSQAELQERELQQVLPRLARNRDIDQPAVDELLAAYQFLRRAENFVQAIRDRQTHDVPTEPLDQARLALAMGYADWPSFETQLRAHRNNVSAQFARIAFRGQPAAIGDLQAQLERAWSSVDTVADWAALLAEHEFAAPDEIAVQLHALQTSARTADQEGRQRLQQFVPQLLVLLQDMPAPEQTLQRVLSVVQRVLRRSAYLALLNENTAALQKLVELCERSTYVTQQLEQFPVLLDELLVPDVAADAITRAGMTAELEALAVANAGLPSEEKMEALAKFQRAMQFRIALADLNDRLPIMRVSDSLTNLAELVLEYALQVAWQDLCDRHGEPGDAGFAIIAYGKLGGLELSYGSDLDLIFLHDSTRGGALTNGDRPLEHTVFFTRLVRRLMLFLTTQTASGMLYEIDTRLRPDGKSGLLVTNVDAFERYQAANAWTWEHQALLRARPVAGSAAIADQFNRIRERTLAADVRRDSLRDDVLSMRARMRAQLDRSDAEHFDLKQGQGGIGDIEFLVQYLVLANAAPYPAVIEYTDNIRQLDALAASGQIDAEVAGTLQEIYRQYRQRAHHRLLNKQSMRLAADAFVEQRQFVTATWNTSFGT